MASMRTARLPLRPVLLETDDVSRSEAEESGGYF
jgi:hypothetical protein